MNSGSARNIAKSILPERYHWPVRRWTSRLAHHGSRRYCPCCGSHVRGFGRYGERPRSDALCPVCGALERHRLAVMYLRSRRELLQGSERVLHIAPEAPIARVLKDGCAESYVALDIEAADVNVHGDLTCLPFETGTFDCLFCSHVLEHIPDDRSAMAELHRVLRPGGWAMLQVPIRGERTVEDPTIRDPIRRAELFGQPDHVRVYGRDFGSRLAEAAFDVSVERPQEDFDSETVVKYGLNSPERIYFCRRTC